MNDFRRNLISQLGGITLILTVAMHVTAIPQNDEAIIREIINDALGRLNKGDFSAIADYWDENADYVGVDGTFVKGRYNIQAL
jgi:hypothetical protein